MAIRNVSGNDNSNLLPVIMAIMEMRRQESKNEMERGRSDRQLSLQEKMWNAERSDREEERMLGLMDEKQKKNYLKQKYGISDSEADKVTSSPSALKEAYKEGGIFNALGEAGTSGIAGLSGMLLGDKAARRTKKFLDESTLGDLGNLYKEGFQRMVMGQEPGKRIVKALGKGKGFPSRKGGVSPEVLSLLGGANQPNIASDSGMGQWGARQELASDMAGTPEQLPPEEAAKRIGMMNNPDMNNEGYLGSGPGDGGAEMQDAVLGMYSELVDSGVSPEDARRAIMSEMQSNYNKTGAKNNIMERLIDKKNSRRRNDYKLEMNPNTNRIMDILLEGRGLTTSRINPM